MDSVCQRPITLTAAKFATASEPNYKPVFSSARVLGARMALGRNRA